MNERTLVRILISIPEANLIVRLLHNDKDAHADLIREIEMATGDAYLEAEENEFKPTGE